MTRQDPISQASNTDTISSTARTMTNVGFTSDELDNADQAVFTVTGGAIRFLYDGGAPTADFGFFLAADATPLIVVGREDVKRLQFIRVTVDAELYISLEK